MIKRCIEVGQAVHLYDFAIRNKKTEAVCPGTYVNPNKFIIQGGVVLGQRKRSRR